MSLRRRRPAIRHPRDAANPSGDAARGGGEHFRRGADPYRLGTRRRSAVFVLFIAAGLIALVVASPASAATRTWSGLGTTNNWTEAANWVGGLIPGAADVATFDGTSAKAATINANISVGGIDITAAYAGAITQAPGSTVTVGASGFSQAGATFTGGTAAMTVNGPYTLSGGSFTATSATLSISGAFTDSSAGSFNAGTGTVALIGGAATIDVPGNETFNNLTHTAGAKTIAAGDTLTVSGNTVLTAGSLAGTGTLAARGAISQASGYGGGAATLLIDGTGAQTFTGAATTAAGTLPALVINKPSGTLTLAGTIRTTNSWTYTAGTLDPGTSTVVFAGGTVSGSHSLNNVEFRATTSIAAGTTLTATGSTALTGGCAQRHRHPGRAGGHQPGSRLRRRDRHPADRRRGRPDPDRILRGRGREPAGRRHQQAVWHPHPGGDGGSIHPHHQQLDVHRGDPRPGHLHGRLRGWHGQRLAHAQQRRIPGDDVDRGGHDA